MAIEIKDTTVELWFVSLDNNTGDMLGALEQVGDQLKIIGRTRHYHPQDPDNDPHSGKDTKAWFSATNPNSSALEHHIETVRGMATHFKDTFGGGKIYEFLRDEKGTQDLVDRFLASPFVHARTAGTEESPL
jgi:hypothetical protein